jgi:uncharacterized membrane protein YeaQ/YmgE (transglycosylase-associated protein family)
MLIVGLIVGAIARWVMPGKEPGGLLVTIVLGIAGSLIAGFLGRMVGWYGPGQGAGIIASVLGALLLLWGYRKMKAKTE